MKYINLQQLESTCRIVLFAYKPPWRKKKEERGRGGKICLTSLLFRKRVCNDLVPGIHWYTAVSLLRAKKRWNAFSNIPDITDTGRKLNNTSLWTAFVWVTQPICPQIAASEWAIVRPALKKATYPLVHLRWFSVADIRHGSHWHLGFVGWWGSVSYRFSQKKKRISVLVTKLMRKKKNIWWNFAQRQCNVWPHLIIPLSVSSCLQPQR